MMMMLRDQRFVEVMMMLRDQRFVEEEANRSRSDRLLAKWRPSSDGRSPHMSVRDQEKGAVEKKKPYKQTKKHVRSVRG